MCCFPPSFKDVDVLVCLLFVSCFCSCQYLDHLVWVDLFVVACICVHVCMFAYSMHVTMTYICMMQCLSAGIEVCQASLNRDCMHGLCTGRHFRSPCSRNRTDFRKTFFRRTFFRPHFFVAHIFVAHSFVALFSVAHFFVAHIFVNALFRL